MHLVRNAQLSALQKSQPLTTIVKAYNETSWRFKATCGHVKQSAKALAWRFRAGFFVIARKERGRAEYA